jgi:diketogulonate reductase-like aldo/keto reductase
VTVANQLFVDGVPVPRFLYGTAWKEDATRRCMLDALRAGFRGIDTANQRKHYFEAAVGEALREAYDNGLVTREEIFLQTKFTSLDGQDERLPYDPKADFRSQVMQSHASSLEHLQTDHIDSYVLHGPALRVGLTSQDWAIWRAMEELSQTGKVRILGVSNIGLDQLRAFCEKGAVKPRFVQNRCYASRGWDREVREYCRQNDIHYQGFSLLTANSWVLDHSRFARIVASYGCSPAQLVFAFALYVGMIPLTGTTDRAHMREDLEVYNLKLEKKDVASIESLAGA